MQYSVPNFPRKRIFVVSSFVGAVPRLEVRTRDRGGFELIKIGFLEVGIRLGCCCWARVMLSNESVIRLSKLGQVEKNDAS